MHRADGTRVRARSGLMVWRTAGLLACTLGLGSAWAQTGTSRLGQDPVTITSSSLEGAEDGLQVLSGDVRLVSGPLTLSGDRAELRQTGDGQFTVVIRGTPGRIDHSGDAGSSPAPQPPVSAEAQVLTYNSSTRTVELTGEARLTRGGDEITSGTILYDVAERRIRAQGGDSGQVRVTIQPSSDLVDRVEEPLSETLEPRSTPAEPPADGETTPP